MLPKMSVRLTKFEVTARAMRAIICKLFFQKPKFPEVFLGGGTTGGGGGGNCENRKRYFHFSSYRIENIPM
jgi:hypothetical protein